MTRLQTLPYIDIQHDALAVFDDVAQGVVVSEDVWVSCYKLDHASIHGKIKLSKGEPEDGIQNVRIQSRDGIVVLRPGHTTFTIESPSLGIKPTIVRFPRQTVEPPSNKATVSVSIPEPSSKLEPTGPIAPLHLNVVELSPSGMHLAYGGPDGYLRVQPTSSTVSDQRPLTLRGHVGDILSIKWFPSSLVLLSSSSDSTIRIHSTESGTNPRTLTGHKRAVTSLHVLGVGKNVVSGSKDGSVRLWSVGEGKCLGTLWVDGFKSVECMVVAKCAASLREGKRIRDGADAMEVDSDVMKIFPGEIESDTADQAIFLGTSSGTIAILDLSRKSTIYASVPHLPSSSYLDASFPTSAIGGAIQAIAIEPVHELLATGSSKGLIVVRSIKRLHLHAAASDAASSTCESDGSILCAFRRTTGGINSLAFVQDVNEEEGAVELAIADDSGLPCRVRIHLPKASHGDAEGQAPGDQEQRDGANVQLIEEYAGWESVPVQSVSTGPEGLLWFAGGDAGLRRY